MLRAVEPPSLRSSLFQALGTSVRRAGWVAIAVLLVTGLVNLQFKGLLSAAVLGSSSFWQTGYGVALAWKLGAVGFMVANAALHDFVLGPRAGRLGAGTPEGRSARKWAAWLGRLNAVVGIVVVVAAVTLARGLP